MPGRIQHRKATTALIIATTPFFAVAPVETACVILGQVITMPNKAMYINPDADLFDGYAGKVLGLNMYKNYIKHRSGIKRRDWNKGPFKLLTMSHLPIVSTMVRFSIFLFIPLILLLSFSSIFGFEMLDILYGFSFVLLGGILSDILHISMDAMSTKIKKRERAIRIEKEYHEDN